LTNEDRSPVTLRSSTTKIRDDGTADICGHREMIVPVAFAADQNFGAAPVDIFEPQSGDLASAQPETHEKQEYREITATNRRPPVTPAKQLRYLLRLESLRKRAKRHPAILGTAPVSGTSMWPETCKKRRSERIEQAR
jgi:hypothetical protein